MRILLFVFCSVWLLSGCQDNPSRADERLFLNARLLDVAARTVTAQHLHVKDGKIVTLLMPHAELPQVSEVIDLGGQYVMPGFIDMHVHAWGNSSLQSHFQWIGVSRALKANLYAGVFAVLDLFSDEAEILSHRHAQTTATGEARLFAAGPCFTSTGGHCSEYDIETRIIDTPEQAKAQIKALMPSRPDVLKIVYDHKVYGGRSMPTVTLETLEAFLQHAQEYAIKTVVHVGTWQDVREAVSAGADMVTHTPMAPMPEDIPALMVQHGAAIIPTLTVQTEWPVMLSTPDYFDDPMLQALTTGNLRSDFQFDLRSEQFSRLRTHLESLEQGNIYEHMDEAIARLHHAGVPVLVGTDAGNLLAFQGYSLHRELAQLVEAGLSNWDALHAATLGPARMLDIPWLLEEGQSADFIILRESPAQDIQHTQTLTGIVKHGRIIDRERLQEELEPGLWGMAALYLGALF